jgi:hypothetical protein
MNVINDIFNEIEEYEATHNMLDFTAPDEPEDIEFSPLEYAELEHLGNKLPPLMPGRTMTTSMLNFAVGVTKAYRLCYAQFVHFIDNAITLCPDEIGYITRENVDTFFAQVISKRITTHEVNRRYVSALQRYAERWEERFNFIVDSVIVKKALNDARVAKEKYHKSTKEFVDAHKHRPTLHHSVEQETYMLNEAFRNNQATKRGSLPLGVNLLISWNCSMQGFTRGDEVRRCRLADLCHERNYGPSRLCDTGVSAHLDSYEPKGILSFIQQPYCTKLKSNKAHVIGFFRHKDWKRCATSIIAYSIMGRLHMLTSSQIDNFFSFDQDGVPNWYAYYLIDWRDYDSMSYTFKKFFNNSGIKYTKLTHTRKLGIIRAHQLGADRENIILLSKHSTHKVDTSYLPQLPYQAMLASSGFDVFRREEYYIPRSYIQIPDGWIRKIFPFLEVWKEKVNDDYMSDNGMAARNFVNHLLPFLATIILQDGVYFTVSYPDHPYSTLLLHKMHGEGYEEWSARMRDLILEKEVIIQQNREENDKYAALLRTAEKSIQSMHSVEGRLHDLTKLLINSQGASEGNARWLPNDSANEAVRVTLDFSTVDGMSREAITVTPPQKYSGPIVPTLPIIPVSLHKTVVENMEYWIEKRLWMYLSRGKVSLKQLGWDGKTQFRYGKRRDVAMWVKTVAENVHGNTYDWLDNSDIIIEIAAILDEERGKDTVLTALQKFKDGSPLSWIKRRSKKTSYDSTSDNVGYQIQFTESTDTESESDNLPLSSLTR